MVARAADLNLSHTSDINLLESCDIHIHFPPGAVPKDGPSAGLVLPVGGVKDKVDVHHLTLYFLFPLKMGKVSECNGIKRVILPERNLKDLSEVPSPILSVMEILLSKRIEEVLDHAFEAGCSLRSRWKL